MPHTYRVTVQSLAADLSAVPVKTLRFDVTNHDDILSLIPRVTAREVLPEAEVAEFVIGLKLFSEVMLRHRKEPLFAELFPHFGEFMKRLKGGKPEASVEAPA